MKFNKETPTVSVKIQEKIFDIPKPFTEGHVCASSEAGVLNQTVCENTRNNFAARVKKAIEDGTFDQIKMQADIDEYLESYDFGIRRGRGPADPIEREALNIAKDAVKKAIREQGYKVADVETSRINDLAEQTIEANPDIMKEAKRRVEARSEVSITAIDASKVAETV